MHPEPPEAAPRPCHLRVWHAATSTDRRGEFERRCERWLAQDELIHADRFQRTTTRNQHVVGRAMARRLLADRNVAPDQIRFGTGRHGKPQVVMPDEAIREMMEAGTSINVIREAARRKGMSTLREEGIARIMQGVTNVEEVLRTT